MGDMRLRLCLRFTALLFATLSAAVPQPEADPNPDPNAEAQGYTNNAPFSGAIYIVNPNGEPAQSNLCPSYASASCGDTGHPSWCCPSGYSCVGSQNTNGYVGCCPAGSNCGAVVNVASVSTVTVYPATQTPTVYVQPQPQPQPSTVMVYAAPEPSPQQAGFCSTLTMKGPDLPRITQGSCGTILIVNRASRSLKPIGYGIAGAFLLTHLAIARVFQWI